TLLDFLSGGIPDYLNKGLFNSSEAPLLALDLWCFVPTLPAPTLDQLLKDRSRFLSLIPYFKSFEPAVYRPRHVGELKTADESQLRIP
ncbi:hypothetical protein ACXYUI_29550, partial [Klebsiella pneumoniae]